LDSNPERRDRSLQSPVGHNKRAKWLANRHPFHGLGKLLGFYPSRPRSINAFFEHHFAQNIRPHHLGIVAER
jgi:hypothetical protein